jgi:hypothetical protein
MKAARPLLFLTYRTVLNGLRRALTTPRRLISLVIFLGYYFLVFIRPALTNGSSAQMPTLPGGTPQIDFPPLQVIDSVAFGLFTVLSLFLLMGVMSANSTFKPADVDVLFSTPISPKVVLTFRILRDYLITLFIPLLIATFGLRPAKMGWEAIFKNMPNPEYSGMALRFMIMSWLLMSLTWVTVSYAFSLWVNRNDASADTRRKVFGWSLFVFCAAVVGYIGWRLSLMESVADAMAIAQTPGLRIIFFTATFATQMTMAPFTPAGPLSALVGLGGMAGVIGIAYWASLQQVSWMYDQSAIRAATLRSSVELQRTGDLTGLMAMRAREGKAKFLKLKFLKNVRMRGWRALLWKEMILQPRTTLALTIMFVVLGVGISAIGALPSRRTGEVSGYLFLIMQAMVVFMVAMPMAQTGFIEVLKRVDLQKPLPFKSWVTVSAEIGSKSLVGILAAWLGAVVSLCIRPNLWPFVAASMLGVIGFSYLLSAATFFATMLFPDIEDPSQRSLRGLLMMVAIVVCAAFPTLLIVGLMALKAYPVVATSAGSLLAFGIGLLLSAVSSRMYENFNPAD